MKATFVKALECLRPGSIRQLWKLDSPVKFGTNDAYETNYVVVSAVPEWGTEYSTHEAETFLFPARADADVISYLELPGSFRGSMNPQKAIDGLVATNSDVWSPKR